MLSSFNCKIIIIKDFMLMAVEKRTWVSLDNDMLIEKIEESSGIIKKQLIL